MHKLKPPEIVVLSFLSAIILGTILLSLPMARSGEGAFPLIDRVFTATSATCVTGLVVKDTGTFFSPFGKGVILLLFQCGGLGIMTLSTLFAILLGRKLTIKDNMVIQSALDHHKVEGLPRLMAYILFITFGLEMAGALCLFLRWNITENWSIAQTFTQAIFHSVSAFCNAGFSLFKDSFMGFRGDPFINITMVSLIFLGGIGFVVLMDMPKIRPLKGRRMIFAKITLQSKIALAVSAILIVLGASLIFLMERGRLMAGISLGEKAWSALFQSMTARTAGFNTLHIGALSAPVLLVIMALMFIGASPGSTGGGIKTCSFGIIMAAAWSMVRGKKNISIFGRTIPREVFYKVFCVFVAAIIWIFAVSVALAFFERGHADDFGYSYFLKILFEVTSAFGTVGLSAGITAQLTTAGKALIILTMFVGRIGPLMLALMVALNKDVLAYKYPEERVMVS